MALSTVSTRYSPQLCRQLVALFHSAEKKTSKYCWRQCSLVKAAVHGSTAKKFVSAVHVMCVYCKRNGWYILHRHQTYLWHHFWATVYKTVRPMLSDRWLSCLSVCMPLCNVGILWPNGWTDQDETWHGSKPRFRPHCVRWGPSFPPSQKRYTASPILGTWLLRLNGRWSQLLLSYCQLSYRIYNFP